MVAIGSDHKEQGVVESLFFRSDKPAYTLVHFDIRPFSRLVRQVPGLGKSNLLSLWGCQFQGESGLIEPIRQNSKLACKTLIYHKVAKSLAP